LACLDDLAVGGSRQSPSQKYRLFSLPMQTVDVAWPLLTKCLQIDDVVMLLTDTNSAVMKIL
jgi:hypothetical protein